MDSVEPDVTGYRLGRSHDDIIYHHVAGRDPRQDPRVAVFNNPADAKQFVTIMNDFTRNACEEFFTARGMSW
jgi:hypothetical protein